MIARASSIDMSIYDRALFDLYGAKDVHSALELFSHISYPNLGMSLITHEDHIAYVAVGKLVIRAGNPDMSGLIK